MMSEGKAIRMPRIAFIDLEASGLGSASFPTEIGWAMLREDGSVNSDAVQTSLEMDEVCKCLEPRQ